MTHEGNVFIGDKPVCDDSWDDKDGAIVCRELGYGSLSRITTQSHFGTVPAVFALDDVACTGSEARLRDCSHNAADNCGGGEGAGVVCSPEGKAQKQVTRDFIIL